jgi:hypothetical protein
VQRILEDVWESVEFGLSAGEEVSRKGRREQKIPSMGELEYWEETQVSRELLRVPLCLQEYQKLGRGEGAGSVEERSVDLLQHPLQ